MSVAQANFSCIKSVPLVLFALLTCIPACTAIRLPVGTIQSISEMTAPEQARLIGINPWPCVWNIEGVSKSEPDFNVWTVMPVPLDVALDRYVETFSRRGWKFDTTDPKWRQRGKNAYGAVIGASRITNPFGRERLFLHFTPLKTGEPQTKILGYFMVDYLGPLRPVKSQTPLEL